MYYVVKLRDVVRIPPHRLLDPLEQVALETLNQKYIGLVDRELGVVIGVYDVQVEPMGRILPGDGGSYHAVEAMLLCYKPVLHEVVEGPVVDVKDFGIFVRLGPVDGFVHKSQISDEYVEYDPSRPGFIIKKLNETIEVGDTVRARVVGVSASSEREGLRVQLTMRQPYLGKRR
ncbi:MAG: DNA-directed RNA polymerase [Fervidicoccaceae archaeon]